MLRGMQDRLCGPQLCTVEAAVFFGSDLLLPAIILASPDLINVRDTRPLYPLRHWTARQVLGSEIAVCSRGCLILVRLGLQSRKQRHGD
jgi:hypothetical protein